MGRGREREGNTVEHHLKDRGEKNTRGLKQKRSIRREGDDKQKWEKVEHDIWEVKKNERRMSQRGKENAASGPERREDEEVKVNY